MLIYEVYTKYTFLIKCKIYTVNYNLYKFEYSEKYKVNDYVIFRDELYQTLKDCTNILPFDKSCFRIVEPIATICDIDNHTDLSNILEQLKRLDNEVVKSVNNIKPINNNVTLNIDTGSDLENILKNYVKYLDYKGNRYICLRNSDALRYENTHNLSYNLLSVISTNQNDILELGDLNLHLNLNSLDSITLNHDQTLLTDKTALTLDDTEQMVHGSKIFNSLKLLNAPSDLNDAVNKNYVDCLFNSAFDKCVKIVQRNTFYISLSGSDTTADGSKNNPFRTLKYTLDYLKSLNLNTKIIKIVFLTNYYDDNKTIFLNYLNASKIVIDNPNNKNVVLGSFKCSAGKYQFNNVIFENLESNNIFEIKENGIVLLGNCTFKLSKSIKSSDIIYVYKGGALEIVEESFIKVINTTPLRAQAFIHLKNNANVYGNSTNFKVVISNKDGGFYTAFLIERFSNILGFENSYIDVGENIKKYLIRDYSAFEVGEALKSGADGEKDTTAILI